MEPRNTRPQERRVSDNVTAEDLERIANPLSVLHGYTQLLQRRLRRGQSIEDEELLRILNQVESASRSVIVGLAGLAIKLRANDKDDPPG